MCNVGSYPLSYRFLNLGKGQNTLLVLDIQMCNIIELFHSWPLYSLGDTDD